MGTSYLFASWEQVTIVSNATAERLQLQLANLSVTHRIRFATLNIRWNDAHFERNSPFHWPASRSAATKQADGLFAGRIVCGAQSKIDVTD